MGRAEDLFERIATQRIEAIHGMLREAKSEEAFLDFKQSGDQGRGKQLCDSDRKNLSKALSGFANADGGVIVWGVTAPSGPSGDVASGLDPLVDCQAFAARIDDKVSWGTTPPVHGVISIAVPDGSGTAGFVATLIPASAIGPHQSTDSHRYLVRAGSSFQPVTHSVLAGMFGRKPQAAVFANYLVMSCQYAVNNDVKFIEIALGITAVNGSAVVARDAYMSFGARRLASPKSSVAFNALDGSMWQKNAAISPRMTSFIAVEGKRLAPLSNQAAIEAKFVLALPFTEGIELTLHMGCDGAPPHPDRWSVPLERLVSLVEQLPKPRAARDVLPFGHDLAIAFLGLDDQERNGPRR